MCSRCSTPSRRRALKLCSASSANVFTFDGELIHLAAIVNVESGGCRRHAPVLPAAAQPRHGVDARDPDAQRRRDPGRARRTLITRVERVARAAGFRSVLAVPLLREGSPIGAIAVGRAEPGPFPDKQIALLQTFADQAVIAIENVRLFKELEARTTELTRSVGELKALGEVGQAVSSTLDLETVLSHDRLARHAARRHGRRRRSTSTTKRARSSTCTRPTGCPTSWSTALRATPIRKGEGALGRLAVTGEPVADPRHHGRAQLPEPRPRDPHPAAAIGRCWRCRCCARTTCSAGWP